MPARALEELPIFRAAQLPRGGLAANPGRLGYSDLKGRLVELAEGNGTACLSFICSRIREAQMLGEPVVWVRTTDAVFFPPDVAAMGVDLASLAVVQAGGLRNALRATHHLLHSGAFGMVILDQHGHARRGLTPGGSGTVLPGAAAARSPAGARLPARSEQHVPVQNILGRFAHLAEKHGTALVCITEQGTEPGLGSMVSLRLRTRLRRIEPGVFRCVVDVIKDKRQGPGARTVEIYHAPPGLR